MFITALTPCSESSSHPPAKGVGFGTPGSSATVEIRAVGCRVYGAHGVSCVRFFRRLHPEPKTPQRGRAGPRALAPPAWKMAAPGHRGEEQEKIQVWDSERVPLSLQPY